MINSGSWIKLNQCYLIDTCQRELTCFCGGISGVCSWFICCSYF